MYVHIGCGGNDHVFMPFTLPSPRLPFLQCSTLTSHHRWKQQQKKNFIRNVNPIMYTLFLFPLHTYFLFFFIFSYCPGVSSHLISSLVRKKYVEEKKICASHFRTYKRRTDEMRDDIRCAVFFSNSSSFCAVVAVVGIVFPSLCTIFYSIIFGNVYNHQHI